MSNLVIKEVQFNGATLVAVQLKEDGKVYVGVKWVCQGLGLSEGQIKAERARVQEDIVLSKLGRKIPLPTKYGVKETVMIELYGLPLWLAKINANITDNIEIQEKLIDYQLHAADVLAKAFLQQPEFQVPKNLSEALRLAADLADKNELLSLENTQKTQIINELKPKADYVDTILRNKGLLAVTQISKDYGMSGQAMNKLLHGLKVQYKKGDQWFLYSDIQDKGYTHSETVEITRSSGMKDVNLHTKWTQKGRLYLYDLLKDNGYLPSIEREGFAQC